MSANITDMQIAFNADFEINDVLNRLLKYVLGDAFAGCECGVTCIVVCAVQLRK